MDKELEVYKLLLRYKNESRNIKFSEQSKITSGYAEEIVKLFVIPLFKKGDEITLNTGYRCDTGTFIRYDGDFVVWESVLGGEYTSPVNKYSITLLNKV